MAGLSLVFLRLLRRTNLADWRGRGGRRGADRIRVEHTRPQSKASQMCLLWKRARCDSDHLTPINYTVSLGFLGVVESLQKSQSPCRVYTSECVLHIWEIDSLFLFNFFISSIEIIRPLQVAIMWNLFWQQQHKYCYQYIAFISLFKFGWLSVLEKLFF